MAVEWVFLDAVLREELELAVERVEVEDLLFAKLRSEEGMLMVKGRC